ncbi:MAG: FkbM family methyltransferase [Granulosicoccus sp.]
MNKLRFYINKLLGKPTVGDFNLLGQTITLGISASREIRRAHDIEIESELLEHMRPAMQPGDVLYDVGANIGLISILMAKHESGASAQIMCFEPEPRNFSQLANNISLNQLNERLSCHQIALGAAEGEIALHVRGTAGEGRHSIATDKGATDSIQVKLTTMSQFAKVCGKPPTVVKIDVEGAEGQVLAGMEQLMEAHPPRDIFMEIHPKGDGDAMPDGELIHSWLAKRGYAMMWNNTRRSGEHRHYSYTA